MIWFVNFRFQVIKKRQKGICFLNYSFRFAPDFCDKSHIKDNNNENFFFWNKNEPDGMYDVYVL